MWKSIAIKQKQRLSFLGILMYGSTLLFYISAIYTTIIMKHCSTEHVRGPWMSKQMPFLRLATDCDGTI